MTLPAASIGAPVMYTLLDQVNASGMSLAAGTSPSVVFYQGTIYLYFTGSGGDGIWVTSLQKNGQWQPVSQLKPPNASFFGINVKTSPCALVYDDSQLLLAYTGGGNNGVWFSIFNGSFPASTQIVPSNESGGNGIMQTTSPCVVFFQNNLLLYYSGNGNNGIFGVTFDESSGVGGATFQVNVQGSSPTQAMNIAPNTSPSAVIYEDTLYLFFTVGGSQGTIPATGTTNSATSSGNVIWYTTSSDGTTWSAPQSIQASMNAGGTTTSPMNVMAGASPTAFVQGSALYVFWNSRSGLQGTVSLDGETWEPGSSYSSQFASMNISSSPAVVAIGNYPALFWNSTGGVNDATVFPVVSVSKDNTSQPFLLAENQTNYLIGVDDSLASQLFTQMLSASTTPQQLDVSVVNGEFLALSGNNPVSLPSDPSFQTIVASAAKMLGIMVGLYALVRVGQYVIYFFRAVHLIYILVRYVG